MSITDKRGWNSNCKRNKQNQNSRGFVFSLDLAIAVIAMLLMLSLMLSQLEILKNREIADIERIELQRNAIFVIDSMAKNRDEEQPLLGMAMYDAEKHRVLSNEIDSILFENAEPVVFENFFVSSVSIGEIEKLFEEQGEKCISVDRIVLANEKKEMLEAVVCEK